MNTYEIVKVVELWSHHQTDPMTKIEKPLKSPVISYVVQKWVSKFLNVDQILIFEWTHEEKYMDIKTFLDMIFATVPIMINGNKQKI